jgi:hypothetical protein
VTVSHRGLSDFEGELGLPPPGNPIIPYKTTVVGQKVPLPLTRYISTDCAWTLRAAVTGFG